jgi:CRISPR system Cascade subunit CasC
MSNPLYVDIHVLQSVPPSNLNRDDAGTPKQAMYGGARRARVSSQAWKRAARTMFADMVPVGDLATRTKKIRQLLGERVAERTGLDRDASMRLAENLLGSLGISAGKKSEETAYLLFFGFAQLDRIVDLVVDRASDLAGLGDKELKAATSSLAVKKQLESGHPIDVALFGRMVADIPGLNVDAAVQVAHALSTHAAEVEFDYYTAVDDENPKEDTGAAMIGTVEFNSATLYRYATVGLPQLLENLGGDLDETLNALSIFLTAFVRSMPTGHQNSFAHRTTPSLVSVVVRADQPVNLVSAFEEPVRSTDGVMSTSVARLVGELAQAGALWGLSPLHVGSTYSGAADQSFAATLGAPQPFDDVVAGVVAAARRELAGEASR